MNSPHKEGRLSALFDKSPEGKLNNVPTLGPRTFTGGVEENDALLEAIKSHNGSFEIGIPRNF